MLLEDYSLLEKLAQFDREKIPERVVHARGASAKGFFEVRTGFRVGAKSTCFCSHLNARRESLGCSWLAWRSVHFPPHLLSGRWACRWAFALWVGALRELFPVADGDERRNQRPVYISLTTIPRSPPVPDHFSTFQYIYNKPHNWL